MLNRGLVVVTGPTGSGKSTTLAAMVDYCNKNRRDHIITVEDPIEFVHESKNCLINHREVGVHTKCFAVALRGALREDPDIILVGELRDLETIELALVAASTGHLVLGTLHTPSAAKTVDRIIDVFPAEQQNKIRATLSEALKGVVAQNLFKRIDKKGRVAALEILVFTTAIANLVREGKTHQIPGMIQVGKRLGNQPLDDAIMDHLRMKRISPEDAYDKCLDKKKFRTFLPHPPDDDETIEPMRRPELDYILTTMLDSQPEVSDLLFTVDKPMQVESFGELKPVACDPPIEKLTPFQTETVALNLIGDNQWHIARSAAARFLRHRLHAHRQGPLPHQHLLPARQLLHRPAQAQHRDPHAGMAELPRHHQADPAGEDRPGAGHRRNGLRQVHHPGRHPERDRPHQAHPHHHAGGPHRVRSPA